jgi:hypothetical protein
MSIESASGSLTFDGKFVTIASRSGRNEQRISISSITSVRWKPAGFVGNGSLTLLLNGGEEAGILFVKNQMTEYAALRDEIEQAMAGQQRPTDAPAGAPDHLTQLKQLGDLRDAGVLTEEEFATKKALILSRL